MFFSLSRMGIFCLILIIKSVVYSQPFYDRCNSENAAFEYKNQCNSNTSLSCDTFIVYRAQNGYSKLSSIAFLFNKTTAELLLHNNISKNDQEFLRPGREIIIPVKCSCSGTFFSAIFVYSPSKSESFSSISCQTFEGLVNPGFEGDTLNSTSVHVPVKCSCPNTSDTVFMVTYPIKEYDDTNSIARKFGVSEEIVRNANGLGPFDAIFPGTTLFVPLNKTPVLNFNVFSPPQDSGSISPQAMILPGGKINEASFSTSRTVTFYVMIGGLIFAGITSISVVFGTLIFVWLRNRPGLVQSLSRKMSKLGRFSPDFLEGILKIKQTITYFSLDELKIATENFNEASLLGYGVYRGKIGDTLVVIKQVNSREEADSVICILTKIYHFNVVKLEGICEGITTTFLVFEFVENGSLSECLSNSKLSKQLTWRKRIQIIFDLAQGLHYLHYFTKPTYVHMNINSRNILITANWRAKISGFGLAKPLNCSEEKGESNKSEESFISKDEYLAPEFLKYGQVSTKIDVFAFGIVVLELLSGKDASKNGNLLKDFLKKEPQDPSAYLENLETLMDPVFEGQYPAADVLCLAFLAKGCTEDDPLNRPNMNDILKALSNMW
ncbi:hypothetical protein M9H77_24415 [Catharanthus roseus]|uniref:Uncharacterized protein n=1 Tax=Catharanthus roseus TaxID=4058 RepID=A0ACC0AXA3_CATRO|nr:hypothetical protein M9H77_24415 [Catharanthus roseus]